MQRPPSLTHSRSRSRYPMGYITGALLDLTGMPPGVLPLDASDTPLGIKVRMKESSQMSEVSLDAFAAAHADGACVIDVREPGEYVGGHVPGAVLMPMGQLPSRTTELNRNRTV